MKAVLFASDGISFETKSENTLQIKGKGSLLGFIIHSNHEVGNKNNRLEISLKSGVNIRNGHFELNVPFESLSKIKLSGSGTIYTQDPITGKILEVSLSGSGDIELSGTSENLNLQISGSADCNGLALDTQNTSIEISGSGNANVVAHKTLNARISGSGSVHYKGKPDKINTKVSGSGSIKTID
jgi:cytoskeletal protein CcmA (bactofilin family)